MAVINFYDDVMAAEPKQKVFPAGTAVMDAVDSYLDSRDIELIETYNIETGETAYVAPSGNCKILVLRGDEETELSYEMKENDILSVVVVPEELSEKAASIMATIGSVASSVGSLMVFGPGWVKLAGYALIGVGAGLTLWAGLSTAYTNSKKKDEDNTRDTALSTEQNLTLSGGSNQDIVGQRFPFVMGRHLVNPLIVGSPYNVTKTKNLRGEDGGSYWKCLYLAGYSPLRITNIKIGSVWAAYNSTPDDGLAARDTVMHGILQGYTDDDNGDILKKWKNNDLKIEILQRGDLASSETERYGELYPEVCRQTEIEANLLNIKDKEIEGLANLIYKGTSVPNGFKSNSVKFSGSCPKRIEVELNFPNGLYATRVYSDDGDVLNKYYNLPVRIAVQWRFVREGQPSSDADEPYEGGWKDFMSVDFTDGSKLYPKTYTAPNMGYDYYSSLGTTGYKDSGWLNPDDSSTYNNPSWIGLGKTFNFGCEDEPAENYVTGIEDEYYANTLGHWDGGTYVSYKSVKKIKITKELFDSISAIDEYAKAAGPDLVETYKSVPTAVRVDGKEHSHTVTKYVREYLKADIDGVAYSLESVSRVRHSAITKKTGLTDHAHSVSDFKSKFGVNERSYTAVYEFTDEECRTLAGRGENGVTSDCVEVRVLRINPTYFDETQDKTDKWSNMSYQDLCRWKYMRTYSFDKKAFTDKLDEVKKSGGDIASVHAADYPQRPLSKEDMDKFVLIAVSLKQDAAETGGQSLSQVSCIAESFCPNYTENSGGRREWLPEKISRTERYCRKYKETDASGIERTRISVATTDEEIEAYKEQIAAHNSEYYRNASGNDFTSQVKKEIFSDEAKAETSSKTGRWLLLDSVRNRYVTNNTASVFALALVGRQMGIDAKTYDDINMEALTDFHEFCSDLTDGTPVDSSTVPDMSKPETLKHFFMACNGVVTSEVKMETLLQKILATGRASLKRDDWNRYEVVIARKQEYPVLLLNQQNVLSSSNSRAFGDIPSGFQVQFTDATDNYTQNDVYIMADGEDYRNPTKEIEGYSFQYVTDREQIWTLGRFNLGCRTMQREVYTRTVGKCGHLLSYGDMVLMADSTLLIGAGNGGRIQRLIADSEKIYGFVVDEPFEYKVDSSGNTSMGVTVLQSKKGGRSRLVTLRLADSALSTDGEFVGPEIVFSADAPAVYIDYYTDKGLRTKKYLQDSTSDGKISYRMSPGLTNMVILKNPVSIDGETNDEISLNVYVKPSVDDIVAFGTYEEITQKAIITAVKPKENEQFELTLVPYDEALYKQGTTMAEFRSHMSNIRRDSSLAEFSSSVEQSDINSTAESITGSIATSIADIKKDIASLYANHIVTLYKDSDKQLTKDDLPTEIGTYSFKDNTLVFTKDGKETESSNGWTAVYPENTKHTIYVTTATAFGQTETDDIELSEWASPIPVGLNGSNGYNARSISLYMRLDELPSTSSLPGQLRYTFATGELEGDLGDWSKGIPDITSSATSLYEIHATALSTSSYDYIEPDEWSYPVKISDGVTAEAVKEILDRNPGFMQGNVSVLCSNSVIAFAVDEGGIALCDQKTTIDFAVKQSGFNIGCSFGRLPEIDGVTYSVSNDSLTVKVKKGTFLAFQELPVPIIYREFQELNVYVDEKGEAYLDENGEPYITYTYRNKATTFTYKCSLLPQKGGRQRTDCETDDDVDSLKNLVLGDYFCFTGESTDRFKQGEVYMWTGEKWIVDTYSAHIMASLDSILSTNSGTMAKKSMELSEHLATNNNYLEKLLSADNTKFADELCANEALIKRLVATEAFIDTLAANKIFAGSLTANEAFINAFNADTAVVQSLYGNQAFLNRISAGLVKVTGAGTIYDAMTQADEQMFETSKTYAEEQAEEKRREAVINGLKALGLDATITSNETVLKPGYIKTDLINAKALIVGDSNLTLGTALSNLQEADQSIRNSYVTKSAAIGAYEPVYFRTDNGSLAVPGIPSDSEVVNTDVLDKWTTKSSKRVVTYTYVCYRYKTAASTGYTYTEVSCEAATIISNGKIVTNLIDVENLLAKNITLKPSGYIQSSNYSESGGQPAAGFRIDAASGMIKSYGMVTNNMTAEGGTFENITATGGTFTDITVNGRSLLNGYLYSNSVPFILCAMINFRSQDMDSSTGIFRNYKTANISSFKRRERGVYDVKFRNPIKTKIFKALGSDNVEHNYLTLLFLGNAHDSRDSFAFNCVLTTNFDLVSIDNLNEDIIEIDEDSMTASVSGATLFCGDNSHDQLVDFITIQGFFVGTEPVL